MSKWQKILHQMANNPNNWRIETLKALAARFDVGYRQPGTSHVTFRFASGKMLTVPAHRPIKPVYIKRFLGLLMEEGCEDDIK